MSDFGIIIPERGQNIDGGKLKYDSRENHMNVVLPKSLRHADLITLDGGTNWTTQLETKREILFSINHKLKYTPKALAYFYVKQQISAPPASAVDEGFYNGGFLGVGAGGYSEAIYFECTSTQFLIKRQARESFNIPQDSLLNHYRFEIKYYILPIDSKMDIFTPTIDIVNL